MQRKLFIQARIGSQGRQRYVVPNDRQKNSQKRAVVQNQKAERQQAGIEVEKQSECQNQEKDGRINKRTRQTRKTKTKGCRYKSQLNWLTQNRHRVMIKVLTGIKCTDRGVYIHREVKQAMRVTG